MFRGLARKPLIAFGALAAGIAAAAVVLASVDPSIFRFEPARNVLRLEAAGIKYTSEKSAPGDWPELGIRVNGEDIGPLTIDSETRKMFSVDVPNSIADIERIDIRFLNPTHCRTAQSVIHAFCKDRKAIVRGLYLNGERLEGAVVSGENNMISLLQTSDGGLTWHLGR